MASIVEEVVTKVVTKNVIDVLCNKCGLSCCISNEYLHETDAKIYGGLTEIEVIGCYFSKVLSDYIRYKFSLCERCLKELFNSFKIPVEEINYRD